MKSPSFSAEVDRSKLQPVQNSQDPARRLDHFKLIPPTLHNRGNITWVFLIFFSFFFIFNNFFEQQNVRLQQEGSFGIIDMKYQSRWDREELGDSP